MKDGRGSILHFDLLGSTANFQKTIASRLANVYYVGGLPPEGLT